MRQDVALLHALREAITVHSNDTDRKVTYGPSIVLKDC
jgi:hypothetical protein